MNKLHKYIVTSVGCTSRIEFCFKRSFDIYEEDDRAFAKKLHSIFKYKNRDSGRVCTGDYHVERISKILKVVLGEEEGEEVSDVVTINRLDEFQGISKYFRNKLKDFWTDEDELREEPNNYRKVPHHKYYSRTNRILVIEGNLVVH